MLVFNRDAGIGEGRQLGDLKMSVRMVIEGGDDRALHFPEATAQLTSPSLADGSPVCRLRAATSTPIQSASILGHVRRDGRIGPQSTL
jgi:hypothetical protein